MKRSVPGLGLTPKHVMQLPATLRDRIKRLEGDIAKLEENAQIYAAGAEDLAKCRRDAKIAEATYTRTNRTGQVAITCSWLQARYL